MTQLTIPFEAEPESKAERCRRILAGDVGRYCQTAAKYFDERNAAEATRLAQQTLCSTVGARGVGANQKQRSGKP